MDIVYEWVKDLILKRFNCWNIVNVDYRQRIVEIDIVDCEYKSRQNQLSTIS